MASDSKGVIEDINNRKGGSYATVVKEINISARDFTTCSFTYEGSESNLEARCLAKQALGLVEDAMCSLLVLLFHYQYL
jgi:hypothetical protein